MRKTLLLLILLFGGVVIHAAKGDINGDGTVNVGDVAELYKIILGTDLTNKAQADLNNDGSINTGDVSKLYDIILHGDNDDEFEFIDIAFAGQGENGTTPAIDQVTVENVATGATKTLGGSDILRLVVNDSKSQSISRHSLMNKKGNEIPMPKKMRITPAISFADARLTFVATADGLATIEVIDKEGKVASRSNVDATTGQNTVALGTHPYGQYTVRVTDATGSVQATKWFSANKKTAVPTGAILLSGDEIRDVKTTPARLKAADSGNTVTMDFNSGDLLKFTAKSGNMTTIMMQQPANSHTNTFTFFECKDADGYCYPIIEAGGLLWMAEDLRYARRSGVTRVGSAGDWQTASTTKCMVVGGDVSNAYYNYEGALKALPEGWRLPTGDEVNTVLRKLGGAEHAGALLKAHGDDSNWGAWDDEVDSLSLRLNAHGYINEDGNVTSKEQRGYIMTSTTLSKRPMWAELKDGSDVVSFSTVGASLHNGFHIRGVRTAFSPYKGMMDEFFASEMQQVQQRADFLKAAKAPVNPYSGQPIGELYTVQTGTMNMVFDWYNSQSAQGGGAAGGYEWMQDEVPLSNGIYSIDSENVVRPLDGESDSDFLKKYAVQYTPDNYKIAKLRFDRKRNDPVLITGAGARVTVTSGWVGTGTATLTVTDKDGFYPTTVTLPGEFTMPDAWETYKFRYWGNNESTWTDMFAVYDFYAKRIQILAADFNGDQTDDLVVGIAGRYLVLDGSDYTTMLAQRTFTGCTATRATTGDFDGDGYPDLAFIFEYNGQITAQVFCDGLDKINGTATYSIGLGTRLDNSREPWLDIKMGDVIVPNRNDLICQVGDVNGNRNYVAKTSVWTRQEGSSSLVPPITRATIEETNGYLQNSCITVVHTRGMGYAADILAASGLQRFDGTNAFSKEGTGMTSIANPGGFQGWDDANRYIYFPADNVFAGKFNDKVQDGTDQLAVLSVIDAYGQWHKWNDSSKLYWIGAQLRGLLRIYTPQDGIMTGENIDISMDNHGAGVRIGNVWGWKEDNEFTDTYTHPAFLAVPGANAHRATYEYVDMNVTFSNPQIHAVLAAAPYYEGADYGNAAAATSWGKSSSSSSSSGRSSSNSAKLITGYNHEIGFITKNWEIDITASVEYNYTFGEDNEEIITWGKEYSTYDDNSVILTLTPYFVYNYKCVASDNEDAVGTMLAVGAPYYSSEQNVAMTDYMLMRADNAEIPDLKTVLKNTPGDPMSYPQYEDEIQSNCGSNIYWALPKGELQGLGQGGTATALTHSVENSTTWNYDNQLNVSFELVNTLWGGKIGFGYGHSESWHSTHSESVGHTISGEVPAPKKFTDTISSFRWNLCRYNMQLNGQTFPVINYVVRR